MVEPEYAKLVLIAIGQNFINSNLIQWLNQTSRSGAYQIESVGRDIKYYWIRFDEFAIIDGILSIRNIVKDTPDT